MYEIDFSPPPKIGETVCDKEIKVNVKKEDIKTFQKDNKNIIKKIIKSKIVLMGIIFSISLFTYGKYEIEKRYIETPQERIYSDVEFMDYANLSKNDSTNFESETAKSIYTIEYQKFAIEQLKKIISFSENDLTTLQNVLPTEIAKEELHTSIFQKDNPNKQSLLISIEGKSSIQKNQMVVNFALHFDEKKMNKIQVFLRTDDDFIIKNELKSIGPLNWHKKTSLIDDKVVTIYEANLNTPVILEQEQLEDINIPQTQNLPMSEQATGNETEDDDENLTAQDLEKHEENEKLEETNSSEENHQEANS